MTLDQVIFYETAQPEFALTPLQLGMVYESTITRKPWVNLEQVVVRLDDEEIAEDTLRDAWRTVARWHEALRLQILWRRRKDLAQVIAPFDDVDLHVEDWQGRTADDQEAALSRYLKSDREKGVDLEQTPSWRVALFRLAHRKSIMVWTIHHALVDGRSMAIVLEDLFRSLAGQRVPAGTGALADLKTFSEATNATDTHAAEAHFREALEGFDQPNALTIGNARDGAARKAQIHRTLDIDLTAALGQTAQTADVTLATLVHVAWGLVVARWSGRGDAVFGVTRSGRFLVPGCERLAGCLINTLPMRIKTQGHQTLGSLLQETRAGALAQRPHEHASLTDIRGWAGLHPTAALFESMVMFERASLTETMRRVDPSWQRRRVELHEEGALPLTLAVYADPSMKLVLEHDPELVPDERATAMLDHFTRLLAAIAVADPEMPLSQLTMLSPNEVTQLQALGQPLRGVAGAVPCVAKRFEETADMRADASALTQVGDVAALDFQSLDRRANGLAHRLAEQGAGPGEIVAICLERSPDFVVALLAILKTGAAFLPIDPTYPGPLIDHMVSDSGTKLMVGRPGAGCNETLMVLPPDAPPREVPPQRLPPDPDRLAYVIYTSGSTGRPKGVRVPQRAVTAHVSAIIDAFGLSPSDRCLQFASLSFDVSIEEMLPTLIAGATLVMRNDAMSQSIPAFLDAVEEQGLTVLNLPTAFWHILVDEMARTGRALPGCVRLMIVGGEQINPRSLAKWQRIAPSVRWLNGYGPTETTITCTLHEPGLVSPDEDVPIGRPTGHARAYVLAADGSLAPWGSPGELWIAGPAVSDGYIGQEEKTAGAFRADSVIGEGRMYRTGDRAYWRRDGTLGFLGRQDRQVKLRGFRIDLRHVESVLEREEGVGRALVQVLDADSPGARLVAWVTGTDGAAPPEVETLRASAARHLAAHMLPAIVPIVEFPRTPGGKIDTAALPAPAARGDARGYVAPADAQTMKIAALMARLMRLDTLGPDDSFHDMGGHSLLAVQLIGQIEADFGMRMGVGDLYRNPTPRALSAAIDRAQIGPRYIIPIQPQGSLPPLFGVHVLGHKERFYRPLADRLGLDQPVLGLTVGLLSEDTPIGVEATARCYFDEIQAHYPEGPICLAAVSLGSFIAFELAQQLHAAGREVRLLALFDAAGPAGRPRLTGTARLMAHLRRLRHDGAGHLRRIQANRLADLRNRIAKFRLRKAAANGDATPMSLSDFVAANELAVHAYDAQPISIPLTIFRAAWDVFDSPDCFREGLGWAPVAAAGFDLIDIPGDHLTILEPPHVEQLADHLRRAMRRR